MPLLVCPLTNPCSLYTVKQITRRRRLLIELEQALSRIADIQLQMSRTRLFRGFRPVTTFATAIAAVAAGIWQARQMPIPDPRAFVDLWMSIAIVSAVLVAVELIVRFTSSDSPLQR